MTQETAPTDLKISTYCPFLYTGDPRCIAPRLCWRNVNDFIDRCGFEWRGCAIFASITEEHRARTATIKAEAKQISPEKLDSLLDINMDNPDAGTPRTETPDEPEDPYPVEMPSAPPPAPPANSNSENRNGSQQPRNGGGRPNYSPNDRHGDRNGQSGRNNSQVRDDRRRNGERPPQQGAEPRRGN
ncbi:MAG: hypothetical protein WC712_07015 [Candidatus Brocadiia bacterium]